MAFLNDEKSPPLPAGSTEKYTGLDPGTRAAELKAWETEIGPNGPKDFHGGEQRVMDWTYGLGWDMVPEEIKAANPLVWENKTS